MAIHLFPEVLSPDEKQRMVDALQEIRRCIRWKPGKGISHFEKRRKMKHLLPSTSLKDYEKIISDIVKNGRNVLYLYDFGGIFYYGVRGFVGDNNEWLVIFGAGGVMETAFPPRDIDDYLDRRGFVLLGIIEEVLKWTQEAMS